MSSKHIESVIPKYATKQVLVVLRMGLVFYDVREHKFKGVIPLFAQLVSFFLCKIFCYFVLLNNVAKFICLEDSFIESIEQTNENIKLLCPIENQGILVLNRQVGDVVFFVLGDGQGLALVGFLHGDMGFKRRVHPSERVELTRRREFRWGPKSSLNRFLNFHFVLIFFKFMLIEFFVK